MSDSPANRQTTLALAEQNFAANSTAEAACTDLLRCYVDAGRLPDALHLYQNFSSRLSEQGQTPSEAMQHLILEILESSPSVLVPTSPVSPRRRPHFVFGMLAAAASVLLLAGVRILLSHRPTVVSVPVNAPEPDYAQNLVQASAAYQKGDYGTAERLNRDALTHFRATGNRHDTLQALAQLGEVTQERGDLRQAREGYAEVVRLRRQSGPRLELANSLHLLSDLDSQRRDFRTAEAELHECLMLWTGQHDPVGVALCQTSLGLLETVRNQYRAAHRWFALALTGAKQQNKPDIAIWIRSCQAKTLLEEGHFRESRSLLDEALRYWTEKQHLRWMASTRRILSQLSFREGRFEEAKSHAEISLSLYRQAGDKKGAAEANLLLTKALQAPNSQQHGSHN